MKNAIISPSVLGADFLHFETEIQKIKDAGLNWIHFDVMDGHFVKNISFGNLWLQRLSDNIDFVKDVHIMIENPLSMVRQFKDAGANYLTFHYEACSSDDEVFEVINRIHEDNMKAGLSIKPGTPVEVVFPFLKKLDVVLIMSVEPGRGGQKFIEASLDRITKLKKEINKQGVKTLISVDGGVNDVTAKECLKSGADILVVGQYLFGHDDFQERVERLLK